MNHAAVVDASVVLGRLLPEEHTDRARVLFGDSLRDRRPIFAPPHLSSEVTNAIYQRLRGRRRPRFHITEPEADLALQTFLMLPIQLISPTNLYQEAYALAKTADIPSIYDALYVVLARILDTELWTGDSRLHNTVRAGAPWVRFIGDYSLS